jgi:hypothetical protein
MIKKIKLWFGFFVSVYCAYLIFNNFDYQLLLDNWRTLSYQYLLAIPFIFLISYAIRIYRWWFVLRQSTNFLLGYFVCARYYLIGNFLNNCPHGYGEIKYKSDLEGRVFYSGNWEHCYQSGKGKMEYSNGSIFEGPFRNGKRTEGNIEISKFTTTEKYYALIIGNDEYSYWPKLRAAVNDATEISKILKNRYNFEVTTLINANYSQTVDALINFTKDKEFSDNLLIYYAGHGELSEDENKGYWIPIDGGLKQDSKWISNDIIKNRIKATKAKHLLLVVDSCFAGSISRGGTTINKNIEVLNNINLINRYKMKKTRIVLTSGGNEPVVDTDGGKHSYFANKFIDVLKNNNDVIQSVSLFQQVNEYVVNNVDQTPNRTVIFGTGDDGGDFLFFPKDKIN